MTPSSKNSGPRCQHCSGAMESVTPRGLAPFKRCTSCGRDDRATFVPSGSSSNATSTTATPTKCAVEGCPGTLVGGLCACCEKRAKWAEANMPKRSCEICDGPVVGRGYRKYCSACGPIVQRVQIAKNHTPAKAKAAR